MTVLHAEGLAAGYHGNPVVRDIDLEVGAGEVVALLGPNGAGKTTTLLSLAGRLPLLAGEVRIHGRVTRDPLYRRARAGLGYIPESRSVFMRLTVDENLRVGRCDAKLALELFPELERLRGRLAGQLSGGEQQILSVARMLARRPSLVLADELSLGLAPKVVDRLLVALRSAAREEGIGVLVVEQHTAQALRHADRAYVLRRGAVVLSGLTDEVGPRLREVYLG